jgi:hypothetical protein
MKNIRRGTSAQGAVSSWSPKGTLRFGATPQSPSFLSSAGFPILRDVLAVEVTLGYATGENLGQEKSDADGVLTPRPGCNCRPDRASGDVSVPYATDQINPGE